VPLYVALSLQLLEAGTVVRRLGCRSAAYAESLDMTAEYNNGCEKTYSTNGLLIAFNCTESTLSIFDYVMGYLYIC
jgi:hypothetical protein